MTSTRTRQLAWYFLLSVTMLLGTGQRLCAQLDVSQGASITTTKAKVWFQNLKKLVPSGQMTCQLKGSKSHNNVDIIRFDNRYYMAFRAAPTHFASAKTRLFIMSSPDGENWECETEIHLGNDLREPRFLDLNGRLMLYFFEAGSNMFKFEPKHIWQTERKPGIGWTELTDTKLNGYVPWRLRMHNGRALLSAYNGQNLYNGNHVGEIRLFESADGVNWTPLSKKPQVTATSCEEGEFIFDDNGDLWATIRLEGYGGMIAYAPKDNISQWTTVHTKYKYDSALMFKHKGEIYVIARRNVDGPFVKDPWWLPKFLHKAYNLVRFSLTTKRTALFRLDRVTKDLVHVFDFPSTGDTAFAGIAPLEDDRYLVVNYSNDPAGPDIPWIFGQLGESHLYSYELVFDHN